MKRKYFFILLIIIQICIIGILFQQMYNKNTVLGTSINPIRKETVISSASGELQYFYEPKANTSTKPEVIFKGLEDVTYTINADSLNQEENYPIKKEKGTYRIVTLGDSHTFGVNLNTENNYPSQLSKLLNEKLSCPTVNKFEILNLGVGGYDIQYTVERFKQRGKKYNPDLVIWLLVPDDFTRVLEKLRPKLQEQVEKAKETGEYEKNLANGTYYTEWIKAKTEVVDALGGENAVLDLQKTYLRDINKNYAGPLLFTFYPILPEKYEKILQDFQQKRNNTYIHGHLPNIYQIGNPVLLPDRHPNQYGYQLIAENLTTYLLKNRILDCSVKE